MGADQRESVLIDLVKKPVDQQEEDPDQCERGSAPKEKGIRHGY